MYRGFVKNINNLAGKSISSADMRVTSMTIKRDILTKATSDFKVVDVPSAISEGDVFGVYDDFGKVVYLGIIKAIDDNNIQCDQIVGIFDDKWKWRNPADTTIENKIKAIIDNDFANSNDTLEKAIFDDFVVSVTSSTANDFESQDSNYVVNFMQFLFDIYESYGIMLDIGVSFNETRPTIKIGKNNNPVIKLGNNNQVLRNFDIVRETQEYNKLVIYDKEGTTLRATYYATPSGITTVSSVLDRLTDINTVIVCSDDDITDIVASNLSERMYNHKITCQLVLENKLYDFDKFNLGQVFDIYYDGVLYNSILTGYKIEVDNAGKASIVDLTFGKVRYSLENIIYKLQKQSSSSQQEVPTKTSDLENDAGFITDEALDGYVEETDLKTINGESVTGAGDIAVQNYELIKGIGYFGRKWDNGLLEYWLEGSHTASLSSWANHYYEVVNIGVTFPVAFKSKPHAIGNVDYNTFTSFIISNQTTTSAGQYRVFAPNNQTGQAYNWGAYYWGWWK